MKQLLCLVILGLPLSALTLVQNGRSAYSICLSPEASPSEQRGANELQRFVEEMSGARLGIATDCRTSRPLIFVGDSPALRRVTPGFDAASYGPEEFQMKTAGRHIVIAGGRVVESGTHEELQLVEDGTYQRLAALQFRE